MSDPLAIRRILVALDASPNSLAALHAAAQLAAEMEAELLGLFVEDVSLLRIADVPLAREIVFPSAVDVPLTRTSMELSLRAQSQRARETLATVAQSAHVASTFRSVRGSVADEILLAARDADVLAAGKVGWSLGPRARLGSTARKLASSSLPMLLLSARAAQSQFHLLVYFDGTPAARRALLAAAELAKTCKRNLTVLIATAGREGIERMQSEVDALLRSRGVEARYRQIESWDEMSLRHIMGAEQGSILVLEDLETLRKVGVLETLLRENDISLLLAEGR